MRAQNEHDTRYEVALRRALHALGYRYRIHDARVPGTRRQIDISFRRAQVAVFVDGCFWHGCALHRNVPAANSEWWREKLKTNRIRDEDTDQRLLDAGWTPVRVWEHTPIEEAVQIVRAAIAGVETDADGGQRRARKASR